MPLPGELVTRSAEFCFPWRPGNAVELLRDGERFYPAMRAAFRQAQHSIRLELYLFASGTVAAGFIADLCDACARGVCVQLVLDSFGSRGLHNADRRRLAAAGAQLRFYNPLRLRYPFRNLARDHRKLLILDGNTTFVGGAGISDAFLHPGHRERSWRELMLRIEGPVVRDWLTLFREVWINCGGSPDDVPVGDTPTAAGPYPGRVTHTHRLLRQEIRSSLVREVNRARVRVWFATAYFLPSWTIRRALRAAVGRGVDVRLLLPGRRSDHPSVTVAGRRYYARLLRAGVRVYEYQPRFLHMKAILVDDWLSAGSCNMDHWTLRWNLEANQELRDPQLAAGMAAMFREDFSAAREFNAVNWRERSLLRRLLEWFIGWVDRLLTRLGN